MMFVIGIVNVMMNLCYSFLFNCEDDGQDEDDDGCDCGCVRQRDGMTGVIKRREIELGDQFGDCMISVFGEHVHMFDHDPIGRPVTLSGFDLLMYKDTISICLRKDSTILVGSDADVATASLQRLQL